jgi:hypothetical protein
VKEKPLHCVVTVAVRGLGCGLHEIQSGNHSSLSNGDANL